MTQYIIRPHMWEQQFVDILSAERQDVVVVFPVPGMRVVAIVAAERWGLADKFTCVVTEDIGRCKRCGSFTYSGYCSHDNASCGEHAQSCPSVWDDTDEMATEEECNCGGTELYARINSRHHV